MAQSDHGGSNAKDHRIHPRLGGRRHRRPAAVVFAAEVRKRTEADPRVADLQSAIAEATASGAHDEAAALREGHAAIRAIRPSGR